MKHIIIPELTQAEFDLAMQDACNACRTFGNDKIKHLQVSVMYSDDKWYFTATKLCTIKRTYNNPTNPHIEFNTAALEMHNIDYKKWLTILR